MSGGKTAAQPANTTSQVTNTSIPTYLQPYATAMLGGAMSQAFNLDDSGNITGVKGYTPFSAQSPSTVKQALGQASQDVAGFTPLQQQAQAGIAIAIALLASQSSSLPCVAQQVLAMLACVRSSRLLKTFEVTIDVIWEEKGAPHDRSEEHTSELQSH